MYILQSVYNNRPESAKVTSTLMIFSKLDHGKSFSTTISWWPWPISSHILSKIVQKTAQRTYVTWNGPIWSSMEKRYVGDFYYGDSLKMLVRRVDMSVTFPLILVPLSIFKIGHQHLKLVANISKLSPTYTVSNSRHQHQCRWEIFHNGSSNNSLSSKNPN